MPYRTMALDALEAWRAADREWRAAAEGSPEQAALAHELRRLRQLYEDAIAQARLAHLPEPPAFPEAG